jgi:predicted transcriptional regulator
MTATAAYDRFQTRFLTREEWLLAAIDALAPIFAEVGETLPDTRVSVGWPGGRGKKNAVIGQCWSKAASSDAVASLFISPVLDDASRVLDVLAHELVHAIDDCASGHKGRFAKIAKGIGLVGPMTATTAGEDLKARLDDIAADLGEYPHAAMVNPAAAQGEPKQGTRMLKVECSEGSGYIVRMTRKWLDEYGTPSCPCHEERMIEA